MRLKENIFKRFLVSKTEDSSFLLNDTEKILKAFLFNTERKAKTRGISPSVEENLIKEVSIEKELIEDKNVPLKSYNYSYIKDLLEKEYNQKVSLPTIMDRAKKNGFYLKRSKKTAHDREVLTNYISEIIQHDSSYHQWSPPAKEKWYLITSLDDFSRFMLYAIFLKKETSWAHILGLQTVILKHGCLSPIMSIATRYLDLFRAGILFGAGIIN